MSFSDLSVVGIEQKWGNKYAATRKAAEYNEKAEKPRYKEGIPYCLECGKNRAPGLIKCPRCDNKLRTKGNRRKHWVFKRY